MLNNFVLQTCNNPSNGVTITLIAAATGRLNFAQKFTNGATCFYFLDDGTQAEWGIGTLTTGSPDTLARTTVIGNTAGTTVKLTFSGSGVRVYNDVPGEYAIYKDAAGRVSLSLLSVTDSVGNTDMVSLSGSNGTVGVNIHLTGNGATTPGKYLRVLGGIFQIINSAYSAAILQLTDAGVLTVPIVKAVAAAGGVGFLTLESGDASHTGYVALWNAAGVRQGYIGYGVSGAALMLVHEGSASGWATSGNLTVGGTLICSTSWISGGTGNFPTSCNIGQAYIANDCNTTGNGIFGGAVYASTTGTASALFVVGDATNRYMNFTADGWKLHYQAAGATPGRLTLFRSDGASMFWTDAAGNFNVLGSVSAANVSDERTKREITPYRRGLDEIIALEPISYRYNGLGGTDATAPTRWGVSAQQARAFLPEAVYETPEPARDPTTEAGEAVRFPGQLSFDEQPLLYAMINAFKDVAAELAALKARVAVLEGVAP